MFVALLLTSSFATTSGDTVTKWAALGPFVSGKGDLEGCPLYSATASDGVDAGGPQRYCDTTTSAQ